MLRDRTRFKDQVMRVLAHQNMLDPQADEQLPDLRSRRRKTVEIEQERLPGGLLG